ncbi:hypothetical protein [Actinoplanes sp. NBRC 101535]|uniref:hypothetical protein n=1 Tax=Actinoplanes sp. NBRC 101535 TaxID=3032196 RepID=UPI0024A386BC|nr:hypothetical protein [Actinoplanes sp. NBRC 101535]GLY00452.1 hypothetical protein Acsp01_08310 [Actinoplanes sp. NBRC 101535]
MEIEAVRVGEFTLPNDFARAGVAGPLSPAPPGRVLVSVRNAGELVVFDVDRDNEPVARFAQPWPGSRNGSAVVGPDLNVAVFSGMTAVRAVDRDGRIRWEYRHACWGCSKMHETPLVPLDDDLHRWASSGSVAFGSDGRTLWAHVPKADSGEVSTGEVSTGGLGEVSTGELWVVLDAEEGTVLAQAELATATEGSHHVGHRDPATMGLGVGEGQDGSPALWGTLRDGKLHVDRVTGDERVMLGAFDDRFLSVGHARNEEFAVQRISDHAVVGTFFADRMPGNGPRSAWDMTDLTVAADGRLVMSTSDKGHGDANVQHWLVDVRRVEVIGSIRYPADATTTETDGPPPDPAEGAAAAPPPITLGDGTWLTRGADRRRLTRWTTGDLPEAAPQ